MVRLVALYKRPADPAAFDKHYFEGHKPLAEKIPGLVELKVGKVFGKSPWYLWAELSFKDKDAFKAAMSSPENAAAGKNLESFAKDLVEFVMVDESPAPVAR